MGTDRLGRRLGKISFNKLNHDAIVEVGVVSLRRVRRISLLGHALSAGGCSGETRRGGWSVRLGR